MFYWVLNTLLHTYINMQVSPIEIIGILNIFAVKSKEMK